jgi:hypothetical protein
MTPLAGKIANQLTLPIKRRTFENERVLSLFSQEMHCFEVSAIAGSIGKAMDEANVWPDVASILPDLFLPSPVTWLEFHHDGKRIGYIFERHDDWFHLTIVMDATEAGKTVHTFDFANFRHCSILESPDRVKIELMDAPTFVEALSDSDALPTPQFLENEAMLLKCSNGSLTESEVKPENIAFAKARRELLEFGYKAKLDELERASVWHDAAGLAHHAIAFGVLALDLINTPGVVGMRQHAPHIGLAKKLAKIGTGSYPLRAWSEVTIKANTIYDDGEYESGSTYHKCLHFVRAHHRHYKNGKLAVVRAHWRGDPALGIKRTRYRVSA